MEELEELEGAREGEGTECGWRKVMDLVQSIRGLAAKTFRG